MKKIIGNTSTWGLYFNLESSPSRVFIPSLVLVKEFSKNRNAKVVPGKKSFNKFPLRHDTVSSDVSTQCVMKQLLIFKIQFSG